MSKALKLGKVSATGGFNLFLGRAISTIIMALCSILLGRFMLPSEYGLYTIALVPSATLTLFHDWGLNNAITKYVAKYKATDQEERIHDVIALGLIFKSVTGLLLSVSSFFLANFIATTFFNRPEISSLVSITSLVILSDSLLTASQSNFNGFEKMNFNSYTMICQAIVKTSISPLLILLGYGAVGAVLGYTISYIVAAILGLVILYFQIFRRLKASHSSRTDKINTFKMMIHYGVPLSISAMLGSFLTRFISFLMVFYCSDVLIGNYQVATNFSLFLSFFTFPIATVLFPTFSKLDVKKELSLLRTVFISAVKYSAFFLVPATMITIVLSESMVSILYGQKWVQAPYFLILCVLQNFLILIGDIVINSFLVGVGETKILLKLSILRLLLGIPLAFILIPAYEITGVILGSLLAGLPTVFISIYWLWKKYDIKADFKTSARIFFASTIATIATFFSLNILNTLVLIELVIGATIFIIVYLISSPLIGSISKTDIQTLKQMFSNLGPISKLINIPLKLAEKLTR